VALLDQNGTPAVTVRFKAPAVGLWSPFGKKAPFICIEPWYGVHDYVNYTGEFKDRYLMNHLLPGASFLSEYTITI
jgi:galactose mutarotase-like enzyme